LGFNNKIEQTTQGWGRGKGPIKGAKRPWWRLTSNKLKNAFKSGGSGRECAKTMTLGLVC